MKLKMINLGEIGYTNPDEFIADHCKDYHYKDIKVIYKWTWFGLKRQKTIIY